MEIWKNIIGYENYQVSNLGNIKSLNYNKTGKEKLLKIQKDKTGYNVIGLWKNNVGKQYKVHRLVYCTFNNISLDFKGNLSKTMICHKNDIRDDNRLENLFLGTNQDNINDMISKKRNNIGEKNGQNKYTEKQIKKVIKYLKEGLSNIDISKITKVNNKTISDIRHKKRWKYLFDITIV